MQTNKIAKAIDILDSDTDGHINCAMLKENDSYIVVYVGNVALNKLP